MTKDKSIKYRLASAQDCDAIAILHATSWQENYRGLCPNNYLNDQVIDDRLQVWRERFSQEDSNRHILVAINLQEKIIGFVCTFLDEHAEWGAYLDNLHVASRYQGFGIGKKLMSEAAKWVKLKRPDSKLYLHVLKGNERAINFYQRLDGKVIGEVELDLPWGGRGYVYDFIWQPDQLIH